MGGSAEVITYVCRGGRRPPAYRERLDIAEGGTFDMWRSVGMASSPPSPVGSFVGGLDPESISALHTLSSRAGSAGDLTLTPAPDSPIETVELAGARAVLGMYQRPEGPWGELMDWVRPLLGTLSDQPRAAISLRLSDDGHECQLVHLGQDPLLLDLRNVQVRAALWSGDDIDDRWAEGSDNFGEPIEAGAGWHFDLPFAHGWTLTPGRRIAAEVVFAIGADSDLMPASLAGSSA